MHSYPAGTRLTFPEATLAMRARESLHTGYTLVDHRHTDLQWKESHCLTVLYLYMQGQLSRTSHHNLHDLWQ